MINKLLIVGCGLIGSSILKKICKKKIAKKVFVYEKSKKNQKILKRFKIKFKLIKKIDKKISETTKLELKSLKLLNSESGILTLDEMLYMVSGRVSVLIEIKPSFHPYIEERIFEIIRSYQGSLALQSFDIRAIEWFNKNAPYYKIGLIDNEGVVKVDKIKNLKLDFVSYDIKHIHNEELQMIRKTGIPLLTWTVNDDKKLKKSKEFADNFIFENIKP